VIALGAVQAGERYRVRLAAVKFKGQAFSGLVDDVQLTVLAGGANIAVTTHFIYDTQGRLIGEYTGQGAMMREYAYLQDLPLALIEPSGAVFFIHTDHLNTPRVITNQAGQAVWRWDHAEPFGSNPPNENPSGQGTFTCNLRLPGQYFDRETNTHYNYFRDYVPGIGRYVQSDPIGLQGGMNTYAYVGANPLRYVDPTGLILWNGNVLPGFTKQQGGCDVVGGPPLNFNQNACAIQCCKEHDDCYSSFQCNQSSWITLISLMPFPVGPIIGRLPCPMCNAQAVLCVISAPFRNCDPLTECRR